MKILAAVLAGCLALPAVAQVTVDHDRFQNQTHVKASLPLEYVYAKFQPRWVASAPVGKQTERVVFGVMIVNKNWEYLRCHDVHMLADGKPVPLIVAGQHIGDVVNGDVSENIASVLDIKVAQQLAKAQKIEIQICRTEYVLTAADMGVFRSFINAVNTTERK